MRIKALFMHFINDRILLCRLLLLGGWLLGILFGCFAASFLPVTNSTVQMLIHSRVSIIGVLTVCYLPLLFSAAIVWFSQNIYLIPLAFVKAFLFGSMSCVIVRNFSSAGWLIRWLYMFSDSVLSFVFLRLWFLCMDKRCDRVKNFLYASLHCAVILVVDYFIIMPFTKTIF